jgi:ferredoxin
MILYFSGTNNSRFIAERLGTILSDRVVSIGDAHKLKRTAFTLDEGEGLGFVMPVHGWNLPYIIDVFFKELILNGYMSSTYVYGVFTCGANDGLASSDLKQLLNKKQIRLNASFAVVMPDNYIPLYDLQPLNERVKVLEQSQVFVDQIAPRIKNKENVTIHTKKNPPRLFSFLVGRLMKLEMKYPKEFFVTDKCISCGICAANCPMRIITMVEGKPVWKGECTKCLKCIHYCPTAAIQMNEKTLKRGRYHHPQYPLP